MIDTNMLENRWKKYKIKLYIPYIIILLSSIIIIAILFYIINFQTKNSKATLQAKREPTVKKEITILKSVVLKKESPKKTIKPVEINTTKEEKSKKTAVFQKKKIIKKNIEPILKKVVISPSLNFMKKINRSAITYYDTEEDFQESTNSDNSNNINNNSKKKQTKQTITIVKKSTIEDKSKNSIVIERKNNYQDIEHVIKRFKKNNNPALSLFVAKKYYALQEYDKAYNYALITNDINNEIEASWLIFAKSLVKLNKREKAANILTKYIEQSHSNRAKILLDDIQSGVFK